MPVLSRRLFSDRVSLLLVVSAAAAAVALVSSAVLPAGAAASSRQWMVFEAPGELLDDGRRDAALEEISALGVDHVRVLVYWRRFAPSPTDARRPNFDATDPDADAYADKWGDLDRLMAATESRGMKVHLTPTGPVPRWATRDRRDQVTNPLPHEFEAWMTALGRRYGDRVHMWSIWNEPNHPGFLMPQRRNGDPASPRLYRRLYQSAHRALRSTGNGGDLILFGETLPRGAVPRSTPSRSCAAPCAWTAAIGATRRAARCP